MKTRKKHLIIVLVLASVVMFLCVNGCKKSTPSAQAKSIALCTHCGQIKGSDLCCTPGQTTCSDCGLVKGSPGCCNIPEGAKTAAICTACGQIKGVALCCKPNQPECPECGLVKGSPGCCRIPKI